MSCSHEHHDGHGHDHDHAPPLDTNEAQSLYGYIYHDHIRALNESEPNSAPSIFREWEKRYAGTSIVESDADEQLLIFVPFTAVVRPHSILIRSTNDEHAPLKVKLFKNRDDLDFSSAAELKPQASLDHPFGIGGQLEEIVSSSASDEEGGIAEYSLNRAHFSNTTNLAIFIESNHGADSTKLLYLGLRGEATGKLTSAPIVAMYEAAANPKDHKNLVPGEHMVDGSNSGL